MIYLPLGLVSTIGIYGLYNYCFGDNRNNSLRDNLLDRLSKGRYTEALKGLVADFKDLALNDTKKLSSKIFKTSRNESRPLIAEKAPTETAEDEAEIPRNTTYTIGEVAVGKMQEEHVDSAEEVTLSQPQVIGTESLEEEKIAAEFWRKNSGYELIEKCLNFSGDIQLLLHSIKPHMSQNTEDVILYNKIVNLGNDFRNFINGIKPAEHDDPRYSKLKNMFMEELDCIKKKYTQVHEDERGTYMTKLRVQNDKLHTHYNEKLTKILNDSYLSILNDIGKLEYELGCVKNIAEEYLQRLELKKDVVSLKSVIRNIRRKIDSNQPHDLSQEYEVLKRCKSNWPPVSAIIDTVPEDVWISGVATKLAIENELSSVSKELIAASFVRPNSGIISHVLAGLLSHLVFARSPSSLDKDTPSIIARANFYLKIDDIESFVAELNSLMGWQRILSRNCMQNARRRLELIQVINVSIRSIYLPV